MVPLPEAARAILEALPNAHESGVVFASRRRPGEALAVAVIDQACQRIRVVRMYPMLA